MSLLNAFIRLNLQSPPLARCITTTSVLYAEPLKKKKKLDPQIIKQRDDRRRKKLEKQIRRLEKNARQLKPVDELEVPMDLIDEKSKRTRELPPLSAAESENRAQLKKTWTLFKHKDKLTNFAIIDRVVLTQRMALEELRHESEVLYQEAIQTDLQLLPFKAKGPVSTPPIKNYNSPDGDYIHQTKNWE